MAFDEVQFPPNIKLGAIGGPMFKTSIVTLSAGHEQRNALWSKARLEWSAGHAERSLAEMELLLDFFYARKGRHRGFRFKDWSDYELARQTVGTGTAAGGEVTFQLFKRRSSGGENYDRILAKIVAGSESLWINGVPAVDPTHYSLNDNTGIVTLVSDLPDGHLLEALCEFDVPARLTMDHAQIEMVEPTLATWPEFGIIETRDIA